MAVISFRQQVIVLQGSRRNNILNGMAGDNNILHIKPLSFQLVDSSSFSLLIFRIHTGTHIGIITFFKQQKTRPR